MCGIEVHMVEEVMAFVARDSIDVVAIVNCSVTELGLHVGQL